MANPPFAREGARRPAPAPQPAAPARPDVTLTVYAVLDGYLFSVQFEGDLERLVKTTKRLRELGATPSPSLPLLPEPVEEGA